MNIDDTFSSLDNNRLIPMHTPGMETIFNSLREQGAMKMGVSLSEAVRLAWVSHPSYGLKYYSQAGDFIMP
jgi:hypothetical protein